MTSEQVARRDSGDKDVLWEVVTENEEFIGYCIRKWERGSNWDHGEDLLQDARLACFDAARNFVPNGQPEYWKNYLARYVSGACLKFLNTFGNSVYTYDDRSDEDMFIDNDDTPRVESQTLLIEIHEWCKKTLSDMHYGIFFDSFLAEKCLSPEELGDKYGIAPRSARRIVDKVQARLREEFSDCKREV